QPGIYALEYHIHTGPGCPEITHVSEATVLETRGDLTMLIALGYVSENGSILPPSHRLRDAIPKLMDDFSRAYPVKSGVGRLETDAFSGVAFDIAPLAVEVGNKGKGSLSLADDFPRSIRRQAGALLDRYNEESTHPARYVAVIVEEDVKKP